MQLCQFLTRPGTSYIGVLIILVKYINLFQSKWQHETIIWEGLPCLLPFYITVVHFTLATVTRYILPVIAPIMPAFSLLLPSYYSKNFAEIDASLLMAVSNCHKYFNKTLYTSTVLLEYINLLISIRCIPYSAKL